MEVAGKSVFAGEFFNRGLLKTTDTIVIFKDTYHELGGYISDPSSNYFTDIVIGSTGYLVGGTGDRFIISGDFTSTSTMNTSWNTRDADIEFINGVDTDHEVRIPEKIKGRFFPAMRTIMHGTAPCIVGWSPGTIWQASTVMMSRCVRVSSPTPLNAVKDTSYTPGVLYTWVGFSRVLDVPSPKSHNQLSDPPPPVRFSNKTVNGQTLHSHGPQNRLRAGRLA